MNYAKEKMKNEVSRLQEFKDRLKMLRKEKKLTQVKLGEMLNYGYTAIANYESGRNQPSIPDLKKIASIFDVSLDYLLGVNDIRHPYMVDDDSIEFNRFQTYYAQLSKNSREELLMYMQWLLDRDAMRKEENTMEKSSLLRVAQTEKEYRKD